MKKPNTMTRDELEAEFGRWQTLRFEKCGLEPHEKRRSDAVWRELHARVLQSIRDHNQKLTRTSQ